MLDKPQELNTIEALAANEEKIKQLYLLFATKFADYGEFWQKIAAEEQIHANVIRAWKPMVLDGTITFDESRFAGGSIEAYTMMLDNYSDEVERGPSNETRAINITVGLEESLLENKFFEGWEGDDPRFQRSLEFLKQDCLKHLAHAKQMREQIISNSE